MKYFPLISESTFRYLFIYLKKNYARLSIQSNVIPILAFIVADAGYDLWLGNARGNTYSKRHISLRHDDSRFWDFSFHEMALYDLPSEIDYIYKIKGCSAAYLVEK